jgi:ABC-type glycerol-3-phosphate transport system substrate-binding protein
VKRTDTTPGTPTKTAMTRRRFVETTAVAGGALVAAPFLGGKAPAYAQARKVHYLQWTSFIPAADAEIDRQAEEFTKATGIEMTVEKINQNDMPARITAAIESNQGADVIQLNANQPQLFANGLADHNALLEELMGDQLYDWARGAATVDGVARGVPLFNIGNAIAYRKDFFEEFGVSVPNTWEEYLEAGRVLKNNNLPVGQTLGHTFGDAPTFAYPLLWSFGGMEVDESGKVVIDSAETRAALAFMREFWEAACDPGGFAWDDTSNNRAFLGGTISASLNGASIYFVPKNDPAQYPGLAENIGHFNNPEGPAGRFHMMQPRTLAIMEYSPNKEAAAEYIRWSAEEANFSEFMSVNQGYIQGVTPKWEDHSVWQSDPAIAIYATNPRYGRSPGYAGPWNRESGEVTEKYIIVDMFARAARGEAPDDVVAWAQQELENVYGA